jgi:hypothetical protein
MSKNGVRPFRIGIKRAGKKQGEKCPFQVYCHDLVDLPTF